jgi:general secretion pathway protein D
MRQFCVEKTAATLAVLCFLGFLGGRGYAENLAVSLDDQVPVILLADDVPLEDLSSALGEDPEPEVGFGGEEDSEESIEAETIPSLEGAKLSRSEREIEAEEMVRRMAAHEHGMQSLISSRLAMKDGRFEEAIRMYQQSIEHIVGRADTMQFRREAENGLTEAYYRYAEQLNRREANDEALRQCSLALERDHPRAQDLMAKIKKDMEPKPPVPPKYIPRWDSESYKKLSKDVDDLLRSAREHYNVGEYQMSQEMVERALKRDPENLEALRMRRKIGNMRYDRNSMELESTRRDMISEVRAAWNPRNYGASEEREGRGTLTRDRDPKFVEQEKKRKEMLARMERMIIPEVDFHQANIHDVIGFLHEASVDNDNEFDPTKDLKPGVDIILDLGSESRGTAAPTISDPFAPDGGSGGLGSDDRRVTFKARYISLLEALKIVTNLARLKYHVRGTVVMVVPVDAAVSEIVTQTYPVLPNVHSRIVEFANAIGGARGGEDDFTSISPEIVDSGRSDWQKFFEDMGVEWPRGTRISYLQELGRLVVANTIENHEKLEQILRDINIVPSQIEIEARFVEVQQSDTDSLGFEWLLNDDWEVAQRSGQGMVPAANQQRVVVGANSLVGGFTSGLRFSNSLDASSAASLNDEVLRVGGVLTNPELTMVLHALRQRKNADLLSAPKVTTQSGLEATIKVVTEYIYPTEFTVEPIQGSSQNNFGGSTSIPVGATVEPGAFETREVGVLLTVLPEVSQEGQMIRLTLAPEVVGEPTWRNYGSTYQNFEIDPATQNSTIINNQLPMEQPFFPVRAVQTTISIYNGATVLMGGMITENRVEIDDSIPLLGDIPIIGRLFRSRSDKSEKRNLLIFVTARMVDPAGRPLGGQSDFISLIERAAGEAVTTEVE